GHKHAAAVSDAVEFACRGELHPIRAILRAEGYSISDRYERVRSLRDAVEIRVRAHALIAPRCSVGGNQDSARVPDGGKLPVPKRQPSNIVGRRNSDRLP